MIFGITGSIACGKSTVTKFLRKAGVAIVDADLVARDVVVPGSVGLRRLIETFGDQYLTAEGTLDRPKLASLVFNDQKALDKCNHVMNPIITAESDRQLQALAAEGHTLLGYDGALIIEQGNADKFRPLIVVVASPEVQLTRLMKRNNYSEAEAKARINKQLSSEEKATYGDFLINTNGTLEALEERTLWVLNEIKFIAYKKDKLT
jgi:dephospho-CoA kinase